MNLQEVASMPEGQRNQFILNSLGKKDCLGIFQEIPEAEIDKYPVSVRNAWRTGRMIDENSN